MDAYECALCELCVCVYVATGLYVCVSDLCEYVACVCMCHNVCACAILCVRVSVILSASSDVCCFSCVTLSVLLSQGDGVTYDESTELLACDSSLIPLLRS